MYNNNTAHKNKHQPAWNQCFFYPFQNHKYIFCFPFPLEKPGNLKAEPTSKKYWLSTVRLHAFYLWDHKVFILNKVCLYMEPQCFQEKQISYLQHRRAKWDKTWKIASSKALKEKMPNWGTQTTPINTKPPKHFYWNYGITQKFSDNCTNRNTSDQVCDTHTHKAIPTSLREQDSTTATIAPRACPYTWADKRRDDIT